MPTDVDLPIYLDNHATTRVDPRVVAAMLPYWDSAYGNAGSLHHPFGDAARESVRQSRQLIADSLGASADEIVFTSGATEANNLAIRGVALHPRNSRRQLVSLTTEHFAVLDPLRRLQRKGFEVTLLPVKPDGQPDAGRIELRDLEQAVGEQTALVSVMLANNEIGTLQPIREIAAITHAQGGWLHCDATQAVGKIPLDVRELGVDLLSFTAHKIYGPKGIGALYVRQGSPRVRIEPQLDGGGQEQGLRSGTLNVPGIVGFAKALELCLAELPAESVRIQALRDRLFQGLQESIPGVALNGPSLNDPALRLGGNLNCRFAGVDGQAIQLKVPQIALSSGAACTSTKPEPSHVLRGLGLSDDEVRASLRFGVGRFNTRQEIDYTIDRLSVAVAELRALGG